jgi:hypothetical protein
MSGFSDMGFRDRTTVVMSTEAKRSGETCFLSATPQIHPKNALSLKDYGTA